MEGKGKHAKCTFCNVVQDNLAEHLDAEHLKVGNTADVIQQLMIQIDQMENKITQLQTAALLYCSMTR
ncbi:MAG: hypothetical protein ACRD8W_20590 [Nitrososphaeraceae archaeon]